MRKSSNSAKLERIAATLTALAAAKKREIRRRRLPQELTVDAMHFLTSVLDGMTETDYARRHAQIYKRLCEAMGS